MALRREKSSLIEELGKGRGMVSPFSDRDALDINESWNIPPTHASKWGSFRGSGEIAEASPLPRPPLFFLSYVACPLQSSQPRLYRAPMYSMELLPTPAWLSSCCQPKNLLSHSLLLWSPPIDFMVGTFLR